MADLHRQIILFYGTPLAWSGGRQKLLGENAEYVVVTDQYAGYDYIAQEKRQLCWAHILRNVIALAQSWGERMWQ